jgi:hypothetical protein
MRRRALSLVLVLAALGIALAAAGCGGSSSGSALDDSMGYMPKNYLAIVAFKTDPDDAQIKNVGKLIDKFPFASAIKTRLKQQLSVGSGVDFDKDIKPLLGNDFVVGIPPGQGPGGQNFVAAWQTKGGDLKKLASKDARKIGSEEGADLYQGTNGQISAVKDKTIIVARTRALLDTALKDKSQSDHLTESDFNDGLGDLDTGALVRVVGDFPKILASSPRSAGAQRVAWVKALRTFAVTGASAEDGLSFDFQLKTEGLSAEQQPLAVGADPAAVVKRPGEVGFGLRDPAQVVKFVEQVVSVTDPKSLLDKDKVSKQLGVDLDKDVVAQIRGDSATSVALDGTAVFRADLLDPAKFKTTLATVMKNLPKAQRSQGRPASTVRRVGDLYATTKPGGKTTYVGVIGKVLVISEDADKAREFAAQPSSAEPETKGALVVAADPRSLVSEALKRQGNPATAAVIGPALSSHLESMRGSVEAEAGGLRGTFKVTIK